MYCRTEVAELELSLPARHKGMEPAAQATPNGDSATRWGQIEQALAKRHGQDEHGDIAGSTDRGSRLVKLKEGQERPGDNRRGVLVTDQEVSCRCGHHRRHRPHHVRLTHRGPALNIRAARRRGGRSHRCHGQQCQQRGSGGGQGRRSGCGPRSPHRIDCISIVCWRPPGKYGCKTHRVARASLYGFDGLGLPDAYCCH